MTLDPRAIERLIDRADVLAGAWSARALVSTTPGCERALLRLAGVAGLDRDGRPLAWAVVDRYLAGRPDRLPAGILPAFAAAALEYDLGPQELALEVAAGAVDLGLEAELLAHRERRAEAEGEAARWGAAALDRIGANRMARRELIDVLGDAPQPWIGATIAEPEADDAADEGRALVAAGVDLVRVVVPPGRELAERMQAVGFEVEPWRPREAPGVVPGGEIAPSGSQRGLGRLRAALDEAAAGRRSYVRIATAAPPLAAPEQAAVAAFERIDLVEADAMAEIVGGVDPDRALADHAFAQRLIGRAGGQLVVGPGPLVVAPDLARGVPSGPGVLAGRALALQLLGVSLARRAGLAASQIVVGALPEWIAEERDAAAQAIAGAALRRRLFAGHLLAFEEPPQSGPAAAIWPFLAAAALPVAQGTALIATRSTTRDAGPRTVTLRSAARVAEGAAASGARADLVGPALEHAEQAVEAARDLLERLANEGWRAVVGDGPSGTGVRGIGAGAVAERSDPFDPLAVATSV
jgi:D-Lysine 5,6-aminomutase TIM-barrel domain of alpha subunit